MKRVLLAVLLLTIGAFGQSGVVGAPGGVSQVGLSNNGTPYGNILSGQAGTLNFANCTVSGSQPSFTITCSGAGTVQTGVTGNFPEYNGNGTTVAPAANLSEAASTLSYIGSGGVNSTKLGTTGSGSGQWSPACGAAQTASGASVIDFAAPTSCTHYRLIWPSAAPLANQILQAGTPSGSDIPLTFANPGQAASIQQLAEPATPILGQIGLNTTNHRTWFVPGFQDNATSPNNLYSSVRYGIDDDHQNLYKLQYTSKAIAAIEKAVASSWFVWALAGDSDTAGITITNSVPIELQQMMQSQSGYPGWGYAGVGFMSVGTAKNPCVGCTLTTSGDFGTSAGGGKGICNFSNGAVTGNGHDGGTDCWGPDNQDTTSVTTGDFVQWQTTGTNTFNHCFVYFAKQTSGGSFKLNLDGSDIAGSTTSTAGSGIGSVSCDVGGAISSATHTLKAIVTTTSSPGVTLLGAIALDSTANGVIFLKLAAASNTANDFALNPKYAAVIAQIQADLSGLGGFAHGIDLFSQQWGANEWTQNITPASMLTAMGTLNTAFTGANANADFLIISDNDDGLAGTTNGIGDTMWQYDDAHQQFANQRQYAFFSTFRRTYPARTALCGTLHLASATCQRMIASTLLQRMLGHTTNPVTTASQTGTPTSAQVPIGQTAGNYTPKTISQDATVGATGAWTNTGINAAAVPASAGCLGTNGSSQIVSKCAQVSTVWTMTLGTGMIGSPVQLLASGLTTGFYVIQWHFSQATTGNCTTPGGFKVQYAYNDGDSAQNPAIGTSSFIAWFGNQAGSGAFGITNGLTSVIGTANVWGGTTTVYATTGTALQYQVNQSGAASGGTCNVQATVQARVEVQGPF